MSYGSNGVPAPAGPGFSITVGRGRHPEAKRPWWWQVSLDGQIVADAAETEYCATPEGAFSAGHGRLLSLLEHRVRMAMSDRDLVRGTPGDRG